MNEVSVRVKINDETIELPKYNYEDDAGMDIVSAEDVVIAPGETKIIKTGLHVELPPGYAFEVSPRSGLSSKTKLRVILGTIDARYRGEIGVIIDNISQISVSTSKDGSVYTRDLSNLDPNFHGAYLIHKGDRIAQLKLKVVPKCNWIKSETLSTTDRGSGGFGSTGVR